MRKNLLIATLVGVCVVGLSACSKGEDKSTTESTPSTAMTQEQATPENQAAGQSADNSSVNAAPVQSESTQIADASSATPDSQTTAPAMSPDQTPSTDSSTMPTATDDNATVSTPSTDSTAPASTDSTQQ